MIQLGAILALISIYFRKLLVVAIGLPSDPLPAISRWSSFIGFLPATVLGAGFRKQIKQVLFSPVVVAIALIVGGIIILIVEETQKARALSQRRGDPARHRLR